MNRKINKEKCGITVRFSVRLPKEQHMWLKKISNKTKNTGNFISMNDYISKALEHYKEEVY